MRIAAEHQRNGSLSCASEDDRITDDQSAEHVAGKGEPGWQDSIWVGPPVGDGHALALPQGIPQRQGEKQQAD